MYHTKISSGQFYSQYIQRQMEEDIMLYLGVWTFQTNKQDWDSWFLGHTPLTQLVNNISNINKQFRCVMWCKENDALNNDYLIRVEDSEQQYNFNIIQKRESIDFLNFQDRSYIQFRNLALIPKKMDRPSLNEEEKLMEWINIELENEQPSKVCIEVYINRIYLEQCTEIYIRLHATAKSGSYIRTFVMQKEIHQSSYIEELEIQIFIRILGNLKIKENVIKVLIREQNLQGLQDIKQVKKYENRMIQIKSDEEPGQYYDLVNENITLAKNPPGFCGNLKDYQKKSLTWMLYRENAIEEINMDMSHIPFWRNHQKQLNLPFPLFSLRYPPNNVVAWNKKVQKQCHGGILADEMGLGKTIMMIALILANKPDKMYLRKTQTLIVVPRNVVNQWCSQIKSFAPQLSVFFFRGRDDLAVNIMTFDVIITTQSILRYQHKQKMNPKVRNSYSNDQEYKLIQNQWFRVIVDEAHNFKNHTTTISSILCQIDSQFRWCLTGTPIQNSTHDLYSLLKFLKFQPWCDEQFWKLQVHQKQKKPRKGEKLTEQHIRYSHSSQLKEILKGVMIRRKKNSRNQKNQRLIDLPELTVNVNYVEMQSQARNHYRKIKQKSLKELQILKEISKQMENINNSEKNIATRMLGRWRQKLCRSISRKLFKLRQLSCHSFLYTYTSKFIPPDNYIYLYKNHLLKQEVTRKKKLDRKQPSTYKRLHQNIRTDNMSEVYPNWNNNLQQILKCHPKQCFLCSHLCAEGVVTPCMHIFCRECLRSHIEFIIFQKQFELIKQKKLDSKQQLKMIDQELRGCTLEQFQTYCPKCLQQLKFREVFYLPQLNHFNRRIEQMEYNDKFNQLMKNITKIASGEKCLIYTSFVGMVYLLQQMMNRQRIPYESMKGQDSMSKRQRAVQNFKNDDHIKVFILTLKTGSIGLNLQKANHVYLMDPWWNPSIQDQAISRAHRNGQQKQVNAIKFASLESIEARVVKYGVKKKYLCDIILDIDKNLSSRQYLNKFEEFSFLLEASEDEPNLKDPQQQQQQNIQDQKIEENKKNQQKKLNLQSPNQSDNQLIQYPQLEELEEQQNLLSFSNILIKKINKNSEQKRKTNNIHPKAEENNSRSLFSNMFTSQIKQNIQKRKETSISNPRLNQNAFSYKEHWRQIKSDQDNNKCKTENINIKFERDQPKDHNYNKNFFSINNIHTNKINESPQKKCKTQDIQPKVEKTQSNYLYPKLNQNVFTLPNNYSKQIKKQLPYSEPDLLKKQNGMEQEEIQEHQDIQEKVASNILSILSRLKKNFDQSFSFSWFKKQ